MVKIIEIRIYLKIVLDLMKGENNDYWNQFH